MRALILAGATACLVCVSAAPSALAREANVVPNPGFEAGGCGATPGVYFDDVEVEDAVESDTIAPQTTIADPQLSGVSTSATFWFSATEASTFECRLDGDAFAACESPATYSRLGDGSHTFQVRAIDRGGNIEPSPAEHTWTVASVGDFSIAASPSRLSILQGAHATPTIQTTVTSGSAQLIELVARVEPAGRGLSVWFNSPLIRAGDRTSLIIHSVAGTPPGDYTITVTGVGESWTHTTTLSLTVTCCGSDFSIAASPGFRDADRQRVVGGATGAV